MEKDLPSNAISASRAQLFEDALRLIDSGICDRRALAQALGISMTGVGRIISALADNRILTEHRSGRTHRLVLSSASEFAVLKIAPDGITCARFGADLAAVGTFSVPTEHALFFDDTLTVALRRLGEFSVRGVVFVSDGILTDAKNAFCNTGISGLDGLDLQSYVRELLPGAVSALVPHSRCAVLLCGVSGTTVCLSEHAGALRISVFTDDGRDIGVAGDVGKLYIPSGVTVESLVRYARNFTDYSRGLAGAVFAATRLILPDSIILSISRYSAGEEIIRTVTESLMRDFSLSLADIPKLSCVTRGDDITLPARRALRLASFAGASQSE